MEVREEGVKTGGEREREAERKMMRTERGVGGEWKSWTKEDCN